MAWWHQLLHSLALFTPGGHFEQIINIYLSCFSPSLISSSPDLQGSSVCFGKHQEKPTSQHIFMLNTEMPEIFSFFFLYFSQNLQRWAAGRVNEPPDDVSSTHLHVENIRLVVVFIKALYMRLRLAFKTRLPEQSKVTRFIKQMKKKHRKCQKCLDSVLLRAFSFS